MKTSCRDAKPRGGFALFSRSLILFFAALSLGASPGSVGADDQPPAAREGTVQFVPFGNEDDVPPQFRLQPHEFRFRQTPLKSVSRETELSEVTFPSPVTTPFECNNTVHCEYFRPRVEGKRPAVVVLHILGGDFPLARLFCRYLSSSGTAALFVKMPYYGPRRPLDVRKRMISEDPQETVEGMRQAVLDIRCAAAWLASREEVDSQQIGIFGISLGGIMSALVAAQEPRIQNVCLMLAGGDLGRAVWQTREAQRARDRWLAEGRTLEDFIEILREVDPATYAERLRGRRMFMLNASRDEVIPPACTESLWERAGKPQILWYDAGHYSAIRFIFDALGETTRFFQAR